MDEINFNNILYLNQYTPNIIISAFISIFIMRYFILFFIQNFTIWYAFYTYFSSQLKLATFTFSKATCGEWLPWQTAQTYILLTSSPVVQQKG